MSQQLTPQQNFRAKAAEAIAIAFVMATAPELRIVGVGHGELKQRALAKLQIDQALKFSLTIAIDAIEEATRDYSDARISQLLQPGMRTTTLEGRRVDVEMSDSLQDAKLSVTNVLTGAGLDVSDGAFVLFLDTRCATPEALKRWQQLTNSDTRLMIVPLSVPRGMTIDQVVAGKRQDDDGAFAT